MRSIRRMAAFSAMLAASGALAAPRDIQIREVNFVTGVVTLHNYGAAGQSIASFQFCTHDEDQIRRYSLSNGLASVNVAPGADFFVHWNNDAPLDPAHINISTLLGNFATPLDNGAYGMGLYFPPVNFGSGATIADHLQWSLGGLDNTTADERSDEAVAGGLWTNDAQWISTSASTVIVRLKSASGGATLHGPADYDALDPLPADVNIDFTVNTADLGLLISSFGLTPADGGFIERADINGDGVVNTADLGLLISGFGQTGP